MTETDSARAQTPNTAPQPRVSVVVPHLNQLEALYECLASIQQQLIGGGDIEIIVVDNGSTVALTEVQAAHPMVQFLSEPQPGPGLARNRGVLAATAPVLAFIDADCRAETGWLAAALAAVEPDPARRVVGGDVRVPFADPRRISPTEAYEAVFSYRQRMFIETHLYSGTGNLAMGRAVFDAVGPFGGIDTAEDMDWGLRAHALGYVTRYIPGMIIYHPARPDFAALATKWRRHVRHAWNDYQSAGQPRWRWQLRAAAVLASIGVHGVKMLTSDRVPGFANRLRGIGMLIRTRRFRAAEMLRVADAPAESGALFWNRER